MKQINPDGSTKIIPNGTFQTVKEIIGGYIETVPCNDGSLMLLDEEGKLKNLPPNPAATSLVTLFPGDFISGTAIVLSPEEINSVLN